MKNISTLFLKCDEEEIEKTMPFDETKKIIHARQRHSKSLDQLKITGINNKKHLSTASNCITRSTSSQMPYNIPTSASKLPSRSFLRNSTVNANNNFSITTSPSTDSGDSVSGEGKKLEQAFLMPYNFCEYPIISGSEFCLMTKMKHSESTLSMPNTNEKLTGNKFLNGNNSESMPNLSESPKMFPSFSGRFHYKKLTDSDVLPLYEINNSTIFEESGDDPGFLMETKSPKRGKCFLFWNQKQIEVFMFLL